MTTLPEGWTAHNSGAKCPVANDQVIEVIRSNGKIDKALAGYFGTDWHERQEAAWYRIIAYRLEQPQ